MQVLPATARYVGRPLSPPTWNLIAAYAGMSTVFLHSPNSHSKACAHQVLTATAGYVGGPLSLLTWIDPHHRMRSHSGGLLFACLKIDSTLVCVGPDRDGRVRWRPAVGADLDPHRRVCGHNGDLPAVPVRGLCRRLKSCLVVAFKRGYASFCQVGWRLRSGVAHDAGAQYSHPSTLASAGAIRLIFVNAGGGGGG